MPVGPHIHGDPHAGNLAYVFKSGRPQIIFYDWGMLGHLSKLERFAMILLTLGLMAGSIGHELNNAVSEMAVRYFTVPVATPVIRHPY